MIYELTDQEWEQIKKYLPKSKTGRKRRFMAKFAGILYRSALGAKTKIHALVDALGYPVKILLSAGNVNDITVTPKLIKSCGGDGCIPCSNSYVERWEIYEYHLAKINLRAAFCRLFTLQVC